MENQSLGTEDKLANTISDGSTVITPQLILGWEAAQDSRNVIHSIIGKAEPDVTLKPATLRTGTLQLLFLTAAEASTARVMLIQALPFLCAIPRMYFLLGQIEGREYLPSPDKPVVYVANHQSFMVRPPFLPASILTV